MNKRKLHELMRADEMLGARAEHEEREAARQKLARLRGKPLRKGKVRNVSSNDRRHMGR